VVCKRVAIDKSTIYRWLNKDEEFKKEFIKALEVGRDSITDLEEGQLITHIKKGSMRAIQYWLDNNDTRYLKPRAPIKQEPHHPDIQIIFGRMDPDKVREAKAAGKILPEITPFPGAKVIEHDEEEFQ
jgi:hypothetical protein